MTNNKILTLLGFASKAAKLSFGFDMSLDAVKRKKSELVLCAEDLSARTMKEIRFYCEKSGVSVFILDTAQEELSKAVGRKCGIVSVNDIGFAKSLKEEFVNDQ